MSDKSFQPNTEAANKERTKRIWTHIGLGAIAVGLAIVTVFVLYMGR